MVQAGANGCKRASPIHWLTNGRNHGDVHRLPGFRFKAPSEAVWMKLPACSTQSDPGLTLRDELVSIQGLVKELEGFGSLHNCGP